jgi:AcrR family transcriptional regulator
MVYESQAMEARKRVDIAGPSGELRLLTRRERRKREMHDRILRAALDLFERQGFEAARIDDICERADVAQKTFFNYFPTKQHLVEEIVDVLFVNLETIIDESRRQAGGTAARLVYFFERLAIEAERAGPMHRELLREVIRHANVSRSQREKTRKLQESLNALIEDGVCAGDVSKDHCPAVLAQMVLNSFFGIILSWVSVDDYPLRTHAAEAGRFLGQAIVRSN